MKIRNIKAYTWAAAFGLFAMVGLGACNTGTDPGETNTERSRIRDEGEMVEGSSDDPMGRYTDTTEMEDHYDHTKNKNKKASAVHAGDGKKDGVDREDVDN